MRGEIHKLYRRFYPAEVPAGFEDAFVKEAVTKALEVFGQQIPGMFGVNIDNPGMHVAHGVHPSVSHIEANDLKPEQVADIQKYVWCRVSMQLADHQAMPPDFESMLRDPKTGRINAEVI